jgi:hypothetical protein
METSINLFADGTSLLQSISDGNISFANINRDLTRLSFWSAQWLVTFNAKKTMYIIFSRKRLKSNYPPLYLNGEVIAQVTHDISWQTHINNIANKSHKRLVIYPGKLMSTTLQKVTQTAWNPQETSMAISTD